jgi:glycerol-3-phosphate dehydrogenase (NAD(P)+)
MDKINKISVIGAGSWGTTLAILLGDKGYKVHLWARRKV